MKQNKKIIIAILLIVLIAGIVMVCVKGFSFDLMYANAKRIELNIGKQFEENDVKQITDEVLGKGKAQIRKVELYADSISITTPEITDEQKQEIVNKVNEKYETELNAEEVYVINIAHFRGRDIAKQYVLPFTISSAIILVYILIRYRKLGVLKTLLKTVGIMILAQLELLSVIAITRVPIGRITVSLVLIVYMLTLLGITTIFEKELQQIKEKEQKEEGNK